MDGTSGEVVELRKEVINMTCVTQFLDREIFRIVSDVAAEKSVRAFVIGGYVRDCFLGRHCDDIDIVF